jgi:hypothetical protein
MPRAMMTRNIKKQQPTKITPVQRRRKRRGGAPGGSAGEVRYAMTFRGDYGNKDGAESIILSACSADSMILSV